MSAAGSRPGHDGTEGGVAPCEVAVVGAGPAGLTAAYYLGRYRRRTLIVHDGRSRAAGAPMAFNVPGFPDGISGCDLLERLERQAREYDVAFCEDKVVTMTRDSASGLYRLGLGAGVEVTARGVILATGVVPHEASLTEGDHARAVAAGALRYCPICDGYEHKERDIAVLGSDLHGAAEAMFLRQYSHRVTLIPKHRVALDAAERAELEKSDIEIVEREVVRLCFDGTAIIAEFAGETATRRFDTLYPALGSTPRSELARSAGFETDADGCLPDDAFAQPLLPGLYAAGDVLAGLDQISTATGHGALAATRLHNWLRSRDGHVMRGRR